MINRIDSLSYSHKPLAIVGVDDITKDSQYRKPRVYTRQYLNLVPFYEAITAKLLLEDYHV